MDIFFSYNDNGAISEIISRRKNGNDTTKFFYDENKRLNFIGIDINSEIGYKFTNKGDTLVKIINNIWREESVIEGSRLLKITSYSKDNTAYSTEEYFYSENGLPDKIVYTDKDGSKTEANFDYEYYND